MSSKLTKSDAERFAEYKAKRLAQKDANKARLAMEFPLLFGQDEKSRSTVGKYTNKAYPTTPSKKKSAKKVIVDENKGFSKSAPVTTNATNTQPRTALSPKKTSLPGNSSHSILKKPSLINFGSFSSSTNIIEPLEMEMKDVTKKAPSLEAPPIAAEEVEPVEDTFADQLNDVLGFLLENNEVDLTKHKQLSTHSFSKETIRRLSIRSSAEIKLEMKRASILSQGPPAVENEVMEATPALTSDAPIIEEDIQQATADETEDVNDAPLEVDDLDVLNALRIYISQLDEEVEFEAPSVPTTTADDKLPVTEAEATVEMTIESGTNRTIEMKIEPVSEVAISQQERVVIGEILVKEENVAPFAIAINDMLPATNETTTLAITTIPDIVMSMSKPQERTVLYPRMTFFQEVMRKGLVHAEVTNWVRRDGHVKYMVYISVLDMPGNPEHYSHVSIMLLKRLSEFKAFRAALVALPCVTPEAIPPLPSRQVASFGGSNQEADYLKASEKYVSRCLEAIMIRQSFESSEYRAKIIEFFSK